MTSEEIVCPYCYTRMQRTRLALAMSSRFYIYCPACNGSLRREGIDRGEYDPPGCIYSLVLIVFCGVLLLAVGWAVIAVVAGLAHFFAGVK